MNYKLPSGTGGGRFFGSTALGGGCSEGGDRWERWLSPWAPSPAAHTASAAASILGCGRGLCRLARPASTSSSRGWGGSGGSLPDSPAEALSSPQGSPSPT